MAKFELTRISNRVRFILAVIAGEVVISNRKRADIEGQLERDGYDRMPNTRKVAHNAHALTVLLHGLGPASLVVHKYQSPVLWPSWA